MCSPNPLHSIRGHAAGLHTSPGFSAVSAMCLGSGRCTYVRGPRARPRHFLHCQLQAEAPTSASGAWGLGRATTRTECGSLRETVEGRPPARASAADLV